MVVVVVVGQLPLVVDTPVVVVVVVVVHPLPTEIDTPVVVVVGVDYQAPTLVDFPVYWHAPRGCFLAVVVVQARSVADF